MVGVPASSCVSTHYLEANKVNVSVECSVEFVISMDERYSEALDKSLTLLVNSLPSILDLVLVQMNTDFLQHQQETIRAEKTSVMKVVKFVGILKSMPNNVFMKFLAVMDGLKYGHVADEIRGSAGIPIPLRSSKSY